MLADYTQFKTRKFHLLVIAGLILVILSGWLPIFQGIRTFMFTWKVELAASIFIAAISAFLLCSKIGGQIRQSLSSFDVYFVVLPLMLFILWSGISSVWAVSWRAVGMHTAIWTIYLIFYFAIKQTLEYRNNFKLLLSLLTLLLVVIGTPVILEYCSYLYLNSPTTLGLRSAKYAEIVNLVCPLLIASVMRLSGRKFWLGLGAVALMWLFVIGIMSRTGLILFVAGAVSISATVFLFSQFKKYRFKTLAMLLVLIVAPIPVHLVGLLSPAPDVPVISRFSDAQVIRDSNNSRYLLRKVSLEMISQHPLIGVGADNFGIELNNFRALYGVKNPDDGNLAANEDEIPERAHNEYLQILAELGLFGGTILLLFLSGILYLSFRQFQNRKHASLFSFAALISLYTFLVSSALSSYSFRLVQNGLIFFAVLAVASKLIARRKNNIGVKAAPFLNRNYSLKPIYAVGVVLALFLGVSSVSRAVSASLSNDLLGLQQGQDAAALYEKSVFYDPENSRAYLGYGLYLLNGKDYREAAAQFRKGIDYGDAPSANYSLLASAQSLGGDSAGAAATFAEAVKVYPRSTFVRTRYADLLRQNGNEEESQNQLAAAYKIDPVRAKTWWSLYQEGVAKTNLKTVQEKDLMIVFDLRPQLSYTAYLLERWIRHPEEKPNYALLADMH